MLERSTLPLLSKWKRLRPKQLQGPAVLVKPLDDWSYHCHLYRNILRLTLLQLYPYKLQSCHELLPARYRTEGKHFAKWAFSKMEQRSHLGFQHLVWT
ncbi:hypothetical protein TNCV_5109131 [Trichonephila clavipes]|nr:hypothetical protein TNCV_5109131 [Trichonephila clavipes]